MRRRSIRKLYSMEKLSLIKGRWVEKAGLRRRRYYRSTRAGTRALASERKSWLDFIVALDRVAAALR